MKRALIITGLLAFCALSYSFYDMMAYRPHHSPLQAGQSGLLRAVSQRCRQRGRFCSGRPLPADRKVAFIFEPPSIEPNAFEQPFFDRFARL